MNSVLSKKINSQRLFGAEEKAKDRTGIVHVTRWRQRLFHRFPRRYSISVPHPVQVEVEKKKDFERCFPQACSSDEGKYATRGFWAASFACSLARILNRYLFLIFSLPQEDPERLLCSTFYMFGSLNSLSFYRSVSHHERG